MSQCEGPLMPHGGYRRLRSYKVAETVYPGKARAMRARLAKDQAPPMPPAPGGGIRLKGLAGLSEFVAEA